MALIKSLLLYAAVLLAVLTIFLFRDLIPFIAVECNAVEVMDIWLFLGGNPNLISPVDGSLLYAATGPYGGDEVTERLLTGGADPNKGLGLYTPLMNAASWVDIDAVRLLLRYGADPTLRNERGQTALDVVSRANAAKETIVRDMLEAAVNSAHEDVQRQQ
jgi:Ankyrin repeats (many copies)